MLKSKASTKIYQKLKIALRLPTASITTRKRTYQEQLKHVICLVESQKINLSDDLLRKVV